MTPNLVADDTGLDHNDSSGGHEGNDRLQNGDELGGSNITDTTSLSQGMSALHIEGLEFKDPSNGKDDGLETKYNELGETYSAQLEALDPPAKEAVLIEMFPGLKPFDITWVLKKHKWNAGLAIDQLLNQVFLESSGHRHKRIEAFSEIDLPARPKRGKGRKNRSRLSENSGSLESNTPAPIPESKWELGRRDVEFVSARTGMPIQQVSSVYHQNGSSVQATIKAIVEAHSALQLEAEDATTDLHAQELSQEFPSLEYPHLLALSQLTYPSKESARELAQALTTGPARSYNRTPIQIEFRLPPPPDIAEPPPKPKSHNAVFPSESFQTSTLAHTSSSSSSPSSSPPPSGQGLLFLRNQAFTRASAAYRKSNSTNHLSGAAAYYASIGRDYDSLAKSTLSAEADSLAAAQSSEGELDLHGITVKNAVRIAREGVTRWWARNDVSNERGNGHGMHSGYRIVTGKGTHSEGGKEKLGSAVGKMLIREGWKVEVGSGFLTVTGVVRRP